MGITPNGIVYPDGTTKAKDFGISMRGMAESLDSIIIDGVGPIAETIVHDTVVDVVSGQPAVVDSAAAAVKDQAVIAQIVWQKANIPTTQDLNLLTKPGTYALGGFPVDWVAQHFPANVRGAVTVRQVIGDPTVIQDFTPGVGATGPSYSRSSVNGVWPANWTQLGAGAEALAAGTDLWTLRTPGKYSLAAMPIDWVAQHLPANVRGTYVIRSMNTSSAFIGIFTSWEPQPREWRVQFNNGAFGDWYDPNAQPPAPEVNTAAASGMKRVGVPLSAGHFGSDAPLEAGVRMPLLYGAPILRHRLRIHDINPRSGATRAGAINLSGIWLGVHTGNGTMSDVVQLSGPLAIADGAVEFRTPWFNAPLEAGTEYLLAFGYTKATAPWAMLGYSYQTADDATAGEPSPAGMAKSGTVPFSISLEAETYAHTPVVASLGDSNSVGVGAANGLHDSWLSQLCRRIKALPVHLGSSGDTCLNSLAAGYKYTRFAGLARPDAAIMALGQNDIAANASTSAAIIPDVATVLGHLREHVSDHLYAVNYMPRTTDPWAGFETVRRELNAHLLTQPGEIRDVFDIAAAISLDDETIRPEFDSDGTHLNAAGFAAVQAAVNRPVTTPPVLYAAI